MYYVGHKEERARKFATEVASLQFNVLCTTYEYIMRDRTKLAKVDACNPPTHAQRGPPVPVTCPAWCPAVLPCIAVHFGMPVHCAWSGLVC